MIFKCKEKIFFLVNNLDYKRSIRSKNLWRDRNAVSRFFFSIYVLMFARIIRPMAYCDRESGTSRTRLKRKGISSI